MFGDVGGLAGAMKLICELLISFLVSNMFLASLIRDVFKVRIDTQGTKMRQLIQARSRKARRIASELEGSSLGNSGVSRNESVTLENETLGQSSFLETSSKVDLDKSKGTEEAKRVSTD